MKVNFQSTPALGWETYGRTTIAIKEKTIFSKNAKIYFNKYGWKNNVSKFLGYIPGVNLIIGIARIVLFSNDLKRSHGISDPTKRVRHQLLCRRQIARGILELTFLGPALLLADIAKTLFEQIQIAKYHATKKTP